MARRVYLNRDDDYYFVAPNCNGDRILLETNDKNNQQSRLVLTVEQAEWIIKDLTATVKLIEDFRKKQLTELSHPSILFHEYILATGQSK